MDNSAKIKSALKGILGGYDFDEFMKSNPTPEQVRERWRQERERIARHNKSAEPRINTGMLTWPTK